VDEMESRLKDAGFKASFPAIRVKFRPTSKVRGVILLLPTSLDRSGTTTPRALMAGSSCIGVQIV